MLWVVLVLSRKCFLIDHFVLVLFLVSHSFLASRPVPNLLAYVTFIRRVLIGFCRSALIGLLTHSLSTHIYRETSLAMGVVFIIKTFVLTLLLFDNVLWIHWIWILAKLRSTLMAILLWNYQGVFLLHLFIMRHPLFVRRFIEIKLSRSTYLYRRYSELVRLGAAQREQMVIVIAFIFF